jgi:hypothetical protein
LPRRQRNDSLDGRGQKQNKAQPENEIPGGANGTRSVSVLQIPTSPIKRYAKCADGGILLERVLLGYKPALKWLAGGIAEGWTAKVPARGGRAFNSQASMRNQLILDSASLASIGARVCALTSPGIARLCRPSSLEISQPSSPQLKTASAPSVAMLDQAAPRQE